MIKSETLWKIIFSQTVSNEINYSSIYSLSKKIKTISWSIAKTEHELCGQSR